MPIAVVHQNAQTLRDFFTIADEGRQAAPSGGRAQPIIRFLEPARIEITYGGAGVHPLRLALGAHSALDIAELAAEPEPAATSLDPEVGVSPADVISEVGTQAGTINFRAGRVASVPVTLRPRTALSLGLKFTLAKEAKPGEVVEFHLVQRNSQKQVVGGITYQVQVQRPK